MPGFDFHDDPILADLNADQLRAVTHEKGPLLILAGAGSGKTRAITRRIAWLVRARSVFPSRILAVTFTNKAAEEMRERVRALLGGQDAPRWMGTFHSICLRLLRQHAPRLGYTKDFVIYDDGDSEALLRQVLKRLDLPKEGIKGYAAAIDGYKNEGFVEAPEPRTQRERVVLEVFAEYQKELRAAGAMDFGDLLVQALHLLRSHADVREEIQARFDQVLVDEFQDTNVVQYDLLKLVSAGHRNLCVVGDDDQSIYSWRGARVENILEFQQQYPDAAVVTLGANYRSRVPILAAAARVIGFNRRRHEKALSAVRDGGEHVLVHSTLNETGEAQFVVREVVAHHAQGTPLSRMAVFYRTNAQSRVFEEALRARRIPYRVIGGMKFFQRKEVKDVIAYLRLLINPADSVSLERVYNVPPRGIGATTIEKSRARAASTGESLVMALAMLGDETGGAMSRKVKTFIETITDLALLARERSVSDVVRAVLERTGYHDHLMKDDSQEGQGRLENVEELVASIRQFEEIEGPKDLRTWLDRVALVQPLDDDASGEALNLMTVHAAKGLEFDCAFVCGLEDGLFPLRGRPGRGRPAYDPLAERSAIEEERRLMYVAMTRARDHLYLTWSHSRMRYGGVETGRPSLFLTELPRDWVRVV